MNTAEDRARQIEERRVWRENQHARISELVKEGKTHKEIADILGIRESTVRFMLEKRH